MPDKSEAMNVNLPSQSQVRSQSWRELVDNPWLMLAMLFFVTAALGLPLLWISRGFSTPWKIVVTIVVLLWTVLVFWVFFLIMAWCVPIIWNGLKDIFEF
jgi:hypothetical protein